MRRPIVAGNWKMNGSRTMVRDLLGKLRTQAGAFAGIDVVVCPSTIHLPEAAGLTEGSALLLGSQNVADEDQGAFTGEVSAPMLREFGCRYGIVGHSERRSLYGESDELVARRFAAAKRHDLVPILCVGETLDERESGATEQVVARQVEAVFALLGKGAFADSVIAYEPVWAIGTGRTASPEQAQEVHAFLRERLRRGDAGVAAATRLLYGGSVKADNAGALFSMADIDGGLIGGASLKADEFLSICAAAARSSTQ
jgi:triosephosphate isomerase